MGNRKLKTKSRTNYDFLKTMEMIFNSVGKEIKLLISNWKGWTYFAYSCYTNKIYSFFNSEGIVSQILDPTKAKVAAP